MEIDVMIIINEYQKEIFRLQKENIELAYNTQTLYVKNS